MNLNNLLIALSVPTLLLTSAMAGGDGWLTDMEAAKAQAAKENKDLLIDFTGSDWCGWCIKLDEEVFSKEPFKAGVKDKFVLVEIDFPQEKKLDPKLKAQNQALGEAMKIEGYPTIMLCDPTGKPYAKTGYQEGGTEAYVKHLTELQTARVKRDEAFATAEKATDDLAKAQALVDGLKHLDLEIVDSFYGDVLQKISKLDKEDTTKFAQERIQEASKKQAYEEARQLIMKDLVPQVTPLMEGKKYDQAIVETNNFIKENPNLPDDLKVEILLSCSLPGPVEKGDIAAANLVVDEIAKTYPNSTVHGDIDRLKEMIKSAIDSKAAEAQPEPTE